MDVVLPYFNRRGSDELRYALRSLQLYFKPLGSIFLIGQKPVWIKSIIHIPFADDPDSRWKERNIFQKIMIACNTAGVSDDFLFFNEDHFLLQEFSGKYYYSLKEGGNELYREQVKNTEKVLPFMIKYFDVHCPIEFSKDLFMSAFKNVNWSVPYGYLIKTIYCYKNNIANSIMAEGMPDCKVRIPITSVPPPETMSRPWFSTSPKTYDRSMKEYLQSLYPQPSNYECN